MKNLLLALVCFSSLSVLSQEKYFIGEGSYLAEEGESTQVIEQELLYQASISVLNQVMGEMQYDKKGFWQKHDAKLNKFIENYKETLYKKYSVKDEAELKKSEAKLRSFNRDLNNQIKQQKRKMFRYQNILSSYSVLSKTRSSLNPNKKFIKIKSKVNRNFVSNLYSSFMSTSIDSSWDTLWVKVNFNFNSNTFQGEQVTLQEKMLEELKSNWFKYTKESLVNFKTIKMVDEGFLGQLEEYKYEMTESPEASSAQFVNEYMLSINVTLNEEIHHELLSKISFAQKGVLYLTELSSNKVLWIKNIDNLSKVYMYEQLDEVPLKVLNYTYRLPLSQVLELKKHTQQVSGAKKYFNMRVEGLSSFKQLLDYVAKLERILVLFRLSIELEHYEVHGSTPIYFLRAYFLGDFDELTKKLQSMARMDKSNQEDVVSDQNNQELGAMGKNSRFYEVFVGNGLVDIKFDYVKSSAQSTEKTQ